MYLHKYEKKVKNDLHPLKFVPIHQYRDDLHIGVHQYTKFVIKAKAISIAQSSWRKSRA